MVLLVDIYLNLFCTMINQNYNIPKTMTDVLKFCSSSKVNHKICLRSCSFNNTSIDTYTQCMIQDDCSGMSVNAMQTAPVHRFTIMLTIL